jgi:hypothetical protein
MTTKNNTYKNVPLGSHIGFFKSTIGINNQPVTECYNHIVAPSKEHMDLAVLNYVSKCGIKQIQSITQEEYESNT